MGESTQYPGTEPAGAVTYAAEAQETGDVLFEAVNRYTLEEHLRFNETLRKKSRSVLVMYILVTIWLALLAFYSFWNRLWAAGIICAAIGILYPLVIAPLVNRYFWKKAYRNNKLIGDGEVRSVFTGSGIRQVTPIGTTFIRYEMVEKVLETDTNLYLMVGKTQGIILQKQGLSDDQMNHIRGLAPTERV